MKNLYIITGIGGLLGYNLFRYLNGKEDTDIIGVDNNSRKIFFGEEASVENNLKDITSKKNILYDLDISKSFNLNIDFSKYSNVYFIHTAAQPAHDYPNKGFSYLIRDLEVNVIGTLNCLEYFKSIPIPNKYFAHISTDKIYGFKHNIEINLKELPTRYDPEDPKFLLGRKNLTDFSPRSFFGCSKLSADFYVQEYSFKYNLNIVIFRPDCITGYSPTGTKLHGFLSYLVRSLYFNKSYTILGYKGKQVRGNIDASILSELIVYVLTNKKHILEIYDISCLKSQSLSILEALGYVLNIPPEELKLNGFNNSFYIEYIDQEREFDNKWAVMDYRELIKEYPKALDILKKNSLTLMFDNIFKSYGINPPKYLNVTHFYDGDAL